MPVYNATPYLEECLNSIIRQSFAEWELLAVDDGSSDNSFELLQQFAKSDPRIKAFSQNKLGIIPALQKGLQQSSGQLICRMDADDRMPAEKLWWMEEALRANGAGHIVCGKVAYFAEQPLGNGYLQYVDWLNSLVKNNKHFQEIYRECVIPSCAWMMHRADFDACGGFEGDRYPEDYDLCFRFYKHKFKLVPLDKQLHFWRDHPDRSSRNDPNYLNNKFLNIKLHYFINIELESAEKVTLWGAGKKGKTLAKQLLEYNIDFDWLTNNPQKAGKAIYGKTLKVIDLSSDSILHQKIILAIAGPDDQIQIKRDLESIGLKAGTEYFFFA